MSNLRALNKTIKAMREDGKLTPSDEAIVELARALARAVDTDPCADCGAAQNAALWREYRTTVSALLEAGERDGNDDDTAEFILSIRQASRAAVGDTEDAVS